MKVLFLGHFSNSNCVQLGASIAGDTVQRKIVSSLESLSAAEVLTISQPPAQAWPKGALLFPKSKDDYAIYPWLINVAFLRDFCFGLSCFFYIIKFKPDNIIQYNSYLFVNLFVLLASVFLKFRAIIIVQDYRVGGAFNALSQIHDKIAGLFVRFYGFVIPVTSALAKELRLCERQFLVFPGAVEHDNRMTPAPSTVVPSENSKLTVVFAGALEKHNGVDKLIRVWHSMPDNVHLVIYGKGSLERKVRSSSLSQQNVSYHGFASKDEIHDKMLSSDYNICFRFGNNIDERFFFPSKFFSVNCYTGFALVNDFYGLPDSYKELGFLVKEDFSNLPKLMNQENSILSAVTKERQDLLFANYRWSVLLSEIIFDE